MSRAWWIIKLALRIAWVSAMVLTPLFGFWLASSIAAYQNASTWGALAIGLALFPVIPVGWDLFYLWRRRRREGAAPTRTILTRLDRLVLRTLLVNGLFLGVMIWLMPHVAFRALAVRGDWMLDGAHGSVAEHVRGAFLDVADHFEKRWHIADERYGDSDAAPDEGPDDAPAASADGWPMAAEPELQISAMPADAQASIATVGEYIAARIPDERRRVKAIHDYVVLRLSYDHAAAKAISSGQAHPQQDAETVFATKTGVCEGYARLMVALGKAAGVDIAYVVGYARNNDIQAADTVAADQTKVAVAGDLHAWNAAKIGGNWTLIDATWDDNDDASAPIQSDYLFTPPAMFAMAHLPEDPKWQLLPTPITAGEFTRRVAIEPCAGRIGVTLAEPTRSQVTTDDAVDLVVDNPHHAQLAADYRMPGGGEGESHKCGEWTSDEHATLHCELPAGTWEIRLYGGAAKSHSLQYLASISANRR